MGRVLPARLLHAHRYVLLILRRIFIDRDGCGSLCHLLLLVLGHVVLQLIRDVVQPCVQRLLLRETGLLRHRRATSTAACRSSASDNQT